jgi:hypothetical protein
MTLILVVSLANLALQVLAAWQRHVPIREHRKANGNAGGEAQ